MEEARVLKLVILTFLPHYLSKRAWYLNKPGIINFFWGGSPCFSNFSIHQDFPCRSSEGPILKILTERIQGMAPKFAF